MKADSLGNDNKIENFKGITRMKFIGRGTETEREKKGGWGGDRQRGEVRRNRRDKESKKVLLLCYC